MSFTFYNSEQSSDMPQSLEKHQDFCLKTNTKTKI